MSFLISSSSRRLSTADSIILSSILILALVLRLAYLADFPWGIWLDEAQNIIETKRILNEPGHWPVFIADRSQMAALPFYIFAPFVRFFSNNAFGLRLATSLVGVLSILSVWVLARQFYGNTVAHVAAFLLAIMRWHLTFSRFGMAMIFTTLFIPLVIYFFITAVQERSSLRAAIGGFFLGLGLQTYYAMVTLPLLLFIACLHLFLTKRIVWQSLKQVMIFFATTLVVYLPLGWYALHNWVQFTQRFAAVSSVTPRSVIASYLGMLPNSQEVLHIFHESLMRHLMMFHLVGDANGRHNLPPLPMLDPITGVLLVLGVLWVLIHLTDWRSVVLAVWCVMGLSGGLFSVDFEAPQAARTLSLTPALAILAAIPVAVFLDLRWMKTVRWMQWLFIIVLLGSIGAYNTYTFFWKQRFDMASWTSYAPRETRIGEIIRDERSTATIYAPADLRSGSTQDFLGGVASDTVVMRFSRSADLPLAHDGKNAVVIFLPDDKDLRATLERMYPDATFEALQAPTLSGAAGQSVLTIARIPAASILQTKGWEVTYHFLHRPDEHHLMLDRITLPATDAIPDSIEIAGVIKLDKTQEVNFAVPGVESELRIFDDVMPHASSLLLRGSNEFHWTLRAKRLPQTIPLIITAQGMPLVPAEHFKVATYTGGLVGRYYLGKDFQAEAKMTQLDPLVSFYFHELPLGERPYAIRWDGKIFMTEDGEYEMGTQSIDESTIIIDHEILLENKVNLQYQSAKKFFTKGWHDLSVRFLAYSQFNQIWLNWKPPHQGERSIVPSAVLRPSRLVGAP